MSAVTLRIANLISLLALVSACGSQANSPQPAAAPEKQAPAAAAEAKPALPEDVKKGLEEVASVAEKTPNESSTLTETGELVSPVSSDLTAKFPGRVGKMFVEEGARVKKGQPLLEIESDYLKIDVDRAEAAFARAKASEGEARRDFERKEGLVAKGSVSQAVYDRTRAALDEAEATLAETEAALNLARQRLADVVMVSPIDGIVAERKTEVGERLGEATVAFVIVQMSPLKVRFRLPERYMGQVEKGQIVRARVDPYPNEVFEGKVSIVVRAVDPATRTFAVEAEIPNRDERLKPGLFTRVELDLNPAS